MVKSINEPLSTAEVSVNMPESANEQAPVAVVTENGGTALVHPTGEIEPLPAPEPAPEPDPAPAPTPPVDGISPVDESGLTEFIDKARLN